MYGIKKYKALPDKTRKAVLERDNYLCQVCGKGKPRRLHVHHMRGHRGKNPDRTDWLVTLCASCHRLVGLLAGHCSDLVVSEGLLQKAVDLAKVHIMALEASQK
jgi:hypothetical protein